MTVWKAEPWGRALHDAVANFKVISLDESILEELFGETYLSILACIKKHDELVATHQTVKGAFHLATHSEDVVVEYPISEE